MSYNQMNFEQRYTIECMLKQKQSIAIIAKTISRNESSLHRELRRNKKPRGSYSSHYAQMLADERKKEGHLKKRFTIQMEQYVRDKLKNQWSPDQIVGKAKKEGIEMVSHERIYQFIWQDKANGGELHKDLRTGMKKYKKRYGSKSSRGQIPNKVSIEQRPKIVEENKRIGDLESDLIIGKDHKGALLTIVDRYSSFLWIADVKGKKKDAVKKATINILASHKQWIHTITNDNGKEFAEHQKIAEKLQCEVFFAHPYSSWERGLNEYTNKLIRQYFPKNKTLENVDQIKINQVIELLNNRPRKKLGYKTPKEVFYQYINQNKKLALAS